ncbi:unnamed protein product [Rotaria magnacalcarata]
MIWQLNNSTAIYSAINLNKHQKEILKCSDKGCEVYVEIDENQRNLTKDQQQLMWSHVQNAHQRLFEKLLEEFSKKQFIPKENKVRISHRFKM